MAFEALVEKEVDFFSRFDEINDDAIESMVSEIDI